MPSSEFNSKRFISSHDNERLLILKPTNVLISSFRVSDVVNVISFVRWLTINLPKQLIIYYGLEISETINIHINVPASLRGTSLILLLRLIRYSM